MREKNVFFKRTLQLTRYFSRKIVNKLDELRMIDVGERGEIRVNAERSTRLGRRLEIEIVAASATRRQNDANAFYGSKSAPRRQRTDGARRRHDARRALELETVGAIDNERGAGGGRRSCALRGARVAEPAARRRAFQLNGDRQRERHARHEFERRAAANLRSIIDKFSLTSRLRSAYKPLKPIQC